MSTEGCTRLEEGHITGVSEEVLAAVARALRRRSRTGVHPRVQWMLDPVTSSAAFVTNGRLDVLAGNALVRALWALWPPPGHG